MKKIEIESPDDTPKAVNAVEYNGQLYRSFFEAEAAKAKDELKSICGLNQDQMEHAHHQFNVFIYNGKISAIDAIIDRANEVFEILQRYVTSQNSYTRP